MTSTIVNKIRNTVIVFVILVLGLYFRRPDAFTNPQLWAEDGKIFLQQYSEYGIKSLFIPYSGYIHLLPRIIAFVLGALHVGLLYIPLLYNFFAFLITFFIAQRLLETAYCLNIKHKVLYATAFMFLPIGAEMFMNLTNTIWFAGLYLVNFIFAGYKTGNKYLNWVVVFIFSLTGPFSLILAPIVILIILIERKSISFQKILPFAILLLGGLIQLYFIKENGSINRALPVQPEHIHLLKLFTNNAANLLFLNSGLLPPLSHMRQLAFCILIFFAFVYIYLKSYYYISSDRKYVLLLASILFLLVFIKAFWPTESLVTTFICPRYYFVPLTCVMWIFILSYDTKIRPIHIYIYAAFFLLHSKFETSELPDRQWKTEVIEYYQGKRQDIDINPEGWKITLPKH